MEFGTAKSISRIERSLPEVALDLFYTKKVQVVQCRRSEDFYRGRARADGGGYVSISDAASDDCRQVEKIAKGQSDTIPLIDCPPHSEEADSLY